MSTIDIRQISITELDTDIIANAANAALQAGGGVCGAIFKAAGYTELQEACDKIGHCDTGFAVITPAFQLKAKYVIHAVGPVWQGGKNKEPQLLYSCYRESLRLVRKYDCHSIAFPLISSGIYGYPKDKAWKKAIQACRDFFQKNEDYDIDVIFAVLEDEIRDLGIDTLEEVAPEYEKVHYCKHPEPVEKKVQAKKSDWETEEMPEKHETFILHRPLSEEEVAVLRMGNIPQEMEDKWFWYCEGNTLYAHRSWTGYCVYIIQLNPGKAEHQVKVNRDPEQYKCTDIAEDEENLNMLLDWWTKSKYDYYHEWLTETMIAIQKQKNFDELTIEGKVVPAVFFHLPDEPYGFLSNWYLSDFEIKGIKFNSNEQYIMYRKAEIFGDSQTAEAILNAKTPAEQQKLGQMAKGYNDTLWFGLRQVVTMRGLYAKFSQNEELKKKLLDTDEAFLVECAYSDLNWACGWRLTDPQRKDLSKWRGKNLLGIALMEVREQLQNIELCK